jgi:hypothetical protein
MEPVEVILDLFGCTAELDQFERIELVTEPTRHHDITCVASHPYAPGSVFDRDRADEMAAGLLRHRYLWGSSPRP